MELLSKVLDFDFFEYEGKHFKRLDKVAGRNQSNLETAILL